MSPELRAALVEEQFGLPTPGWHPTLAHQDAIALRAILRRQSEKHLGVRIGAK